MLASAPSLLIPKQLYIRRKVKKGRERLLRHIVRTAREVRQATARGALAVGHRAERWLHMALAQMYCKHEVLRRFDHRVLAVHALAGSYDLPDEYFF